MQLDRIIFWVRAILLVSLLAFFGGSLVSGLLQDDRDSGFGPLRQGTGQDPGIRVLLTNRYLAGKEVAEGKPAYETVDLTIYQPVIVVTPDDAENVERQLKLPAGSRLTIMTDVNDGLVLSSRDWGAGGKEVRWPANRTSSDSGRSRSLTSSP